MPVTTPPDVDALPPAPVRGQPGFSDATGLFLEALPDFGAQVDAAGQATAANATYVEELAIELESSVLVAADAAGLVAQSTSTLSVSSGAKTIHFTQPKALLAELNRRVVVQLKSDPSIRMFGTVTTATDSDDVVVTVISTGVFGSGTYSSWQIIDAGFFASGATAAEVRAGTTDAAALTPAGVYDALEEVALTSTGGSVAVDMSTFINGFHAFTENTEFANPTNAKPGQTGYIRCQQHASSAKTGTFAGNWKRAGGDPTFSTTLSAYDFILFQVITPSYILYDLIKNPS